MIAKLPARADDLREDIAYFSGEGRAMWELAVVVVQFACVVILVAGAILSVWFISVDQGGNEKAVEPQPPIATAELKRAA